MNLTFEGLKKGLIGWESWWCWNLIPYLFWQVPAFLLIFMPKAYHLILRNFSCKATKLQP